MIENRKQFVTKDYKERFEFKLTVGDNIICQRYFKINNFNELSVYSCELVETINEIVKTIDDELKSKTLVYLDIFAPMYFNSLEEMNKYFENPFNRNRMGVGHGIVVKNQANDYFWGNNDGPVELSYKFDDGELSNSITDNEIVTYKFAFLVDGREVCARTWEGVYPRFIRNAIDISNKRGKISEEDAAKISGFEEYLNYKICANRNDLVPYIVKNICSVCCLQGDNIYTLTSDYDKKVYKNRQSFKDVCKLYGLSTIDATTRFISKQERDFWENK